MTALSPFGTYEHRVPRTPVEDVAAARAYCERTGNTDAAVMRGIFGDEGES